MLLINLYFCIYLFLRSVKIDFLVNKWRAFGRVNGWKGDDGSFGNWMSGKVMDRTAEFSDRFDNVGNRVGKLPEGIYNIGNSRRCATPRSTKMGYASLKK